jgi:YspA, cpYpsA-related SLOG family
MREFRLIVSGSREFSDPLSLRTALNSIFDTLMTDVTLVVVHGGDENPDWSPHADRIAQEWAAEREADGLPVRQEPHPAGWEGPCREECEPGHRQMVRGVSICPAAGPYRNEEMCEAGADWGLAALKIGTKSTGTRDCMRRMLAHGIRFQILPEGKAKGLPQDLLSANIPHEY